MTADSGLRVVVFGATGNVGTSVVEALGEQSAVAEIVGVARRPVDVRYPKTTFVTADTTTSDLHGIVRGADVVIHLAWLFQPTHRPEVTWENNVLGAIRVFRAVADEHVPALVYTSSLAAYSPGPSDRAVSEDWPTDGWPGAAYPREKSYLERWLDTFELRHPDTRVVRMRPCFLFKRQSATEQRRLFIGPFAPGRLVRRGLVPVVPLVSGLKAQVLHTSDAADAIVRATLRPVHGAFNLATTPAVDGHYLADLLGARPVRLPRRALRFAAWVGWHLRAVPASPGLLDTVLQLPLLDSTRAESELDWHPRITPRETLESFLGGLQDGAGLPTPPLAPDSPRRRLGELSKGVGERA
ncbi:NAD-dependent epimerase/dehydratase family protein [Rhodococcus sp. SGAir0479]|uniref:NAD-dependent epimerase/dehydratase family protein n=1 Tax=Rhodococcus sp. SGAir0479 TaxID=2567884 RepID=UPI0010CD075D|nr:NAD-dependent epimerase/dehydratase family protein [Rhodococcus sp. SGAir0479]QCQ91329.1 NAD-dependent epimerase/dehydratase family protein [Rhodococcus sp. SGAir0479]